MTTQEQISEALGKSQTTVSLTLSGEKPISWPIAEKLDDLFPGNGVRFWKNATPEDLERAFQSERFKKIISGIGKEQRIQQVPA